MCVQVSNKAVTEAFVRMYEDGLIYRYAACVLGGGLLVMLDNLTSLVWLGSSNRLVNWSCALRTAISSIEASCTRRLPPADIVF